MNAIESDAIAQTYEDVKGILYKLASNAPDIPYVLQGDDYVSLADEAFMKAWETYNPKRATFVTWVYSRVKFVIGETLEKEKNRARLRNKQFENGDTSKCPWTTKQFQENGKLRFIDMMDELSSDAKCIVLLVLHPPADFLKYVQRRYGNQRLQQRDITDYLIRKKRWKRNRLEEAFGQIKKAISYV